jgi:mono/diheme cytochrome c family protein
MTQGNAFSFNRSTDRTDDRFMSGANRTFNIACRFMFLSVALWAVGCKPTQDANWAPREEVFQLPARAQKQLKEIVEKYCGTPRSPKWIGSDAPSMEQLLRGETLFNRLCAACHGLNGDGAGRAAQYLDPRPTDFRRGIFKFTSTPYGAKPVRDDLLRTIRDGAKGSAMPSFALLAENDLRALVDYVLVLTHRGELEEMLLTEAQGDDEIDLASVPGYLQRITDRWAAANDQIITPISPFVPYSEASIKLGETAFRTDAAGCYKCHGNDGRGRIVPSVEFHPGAPPARAADLTSGMLRGGFRPIDIYRRIFAGINGTPMPSFSLLLKNEPDTIWNLVNYVEYLSDTRRRELKTAVSGTRQPSDAKANTP